MNKVREIGNTRIKLPMEVVILKPQNGQILKLEDVFSYFTSEFIHAKTELLQGSSKPR
ncbi:hypothetical protein COLO4_00141 [Corchorus olitorius]|uniref:Uncharacterized protein n=1 Tax=Corchorus olitorius TaxID=93759 RepID=A0A1R3L4H5_9ROSI|nr:hypothetical protein COLO4_00141 [Corchorus olitorius]